MSDDTRNKNRNLRLSEAVDSLANVVPNGHLLACTDGGGALLLSAADLIYELRKENNELKRQLVHYWNGWVDGRRGDWDRVPEQIQRAMGRDLAEDVAFAEEMRAAQPGSHCDAADAARYRALVALALKGDLSLFVALEMIDEIGDDSGVHNAMDSAPLYLGWLKRGES